jgi:membrane protein DedA with SNARE-associated domain
MSFAQFLPETQLLLALSVFAGTFLYEDGATLLAATLAASGRLDARLGMAAAIAGIWVGDLGLYAAGALISRYGAYCRRLQRFLSGEALAKAADWFDRHGAFAVVMSRMIPGSRLPLYLAAGAMQMPARRFARITGVCAAVWVSLIFAILRFLPSAAGGPGKLLTWLAAMVMLFAPAILGKVWKPASATGELPSGEESAISPCAL